MSQAERTEPRCYGHEFDPAHQSGSHDQDHEGRPAHTWSGRWHSHGTGCQWCTKPFEAGDRYVCVKGGAIHAACVAELDAYLFAPEHPETGAP